MHVYPLMDLTGCIMIILMLIGICNPDVLNIRIFNPKIALQMLIFNAPGLQIRPSFALFLMMTELLLQII